MSLQRNKKELLSTIEHSHYLPILGSLLIGFIIAWSVRKPWFQEATYEMHNTAPVLARDLPLEKETAPEANEGPAQNYGEFQPLIETPPAPETVERNSKLPRPELFVKTTPTKDGYLLSFSITNFTIWTDGHLILKQTNKEVEKVFASPYFLEENMFGENTELELQLVTPEGKYITTAWTMLAEKITNE